MQYLDKMRDHLEMMEAFEGSGRDASRFSNIQRLDDLAHLKPGSDLWVFSSRFPLRRIMLDTTIAHLDGYAWIDAAAIHTMHAGHPGLPSYAVGGARVEHADEIYHIS